MESFKQLSEEKKVTTSSLNIISNGKSHLASGFSSTFFSIPSPKINDEDIIPNIENIVEDFSKTITEEDDDFTAPKKEKMDEPQAIGKEEHPCSMLLDNPELAEDEMMKDYSIHKPQGSKFFLRMDDIRVEESHSSERSGGKYLQGRWSSDEHKKFMEAMLIYGNEWKKVQQHIKTRSSIQARSHAQKFFIRLRRSMIENGEDMPSKEKIFSLFKDILHEEIRPKDPDKFINMIINLINNNEGFKQKINKIDTVSNLTGNNPNTVNLSNESLCDNEMSFLKSSSQTQGNDEHRAKINKIIIRNPNIPNEKDEPKVILENMLFPGNESVMNDDEILLHNVIEMERFTTDLNGEQNKQKVFNEDGIGDIENLSCILPLQEMQNMKKRIKKTNKPNKIFLIKKVEPQSGSDFPVKNRNNIKPSHCSTQQQTIITQSKTSLSKRNSSNLKSNGNTNINIKFRNSNSLEELKEDFIPNFLINTNSPSNLGNNTLEVSNNNTTIKNLPQSNNKCNKFGNCIDSENFATQNNSSQYFSPKVNSCINIVTINLLNEMKREQTNSNVTKMKGGKAMNNILKNNSQKKGKPNNIINSGKFFDNINENSRSTMYEQMTSEQQNIFQMILHHQTLMKQSQIQNNNNQNNNTTTSSQQNSNRTTLSIPEKMLLNLNGSPSNIYPLQSNEAVGSTCNKITQITTPSEFEINSKNPFNLDFNQSFFLPSIDHEIQDLFPLTFGNSSGPRSQGLRSQQSVWNNSNNSNNNFSLTENNNPLHDFDSATNFDLEKYFN